MARRKPEAAPAVDERALERRYRHLATRLMASEPDSAAAGVSLRIRRESARLHDLPLSVRVAALEAFVADLGLDPDKGWEA